MNKKYLLPLLFFLTFCSKNETGNSVFVSILPQKYFVEKIAGNKIKVNVMVGNGMSPETYEPLPQQMVQLSRSKIYFSIGVPFENSWLNKLERNNPEVKFVNTAYGIKRIPLATGEEIFTSHNDDHSHEGILDPHIWLDPKLVIIQAKNILSGLLKSFPEDSSFFNKNYLEFEKELDSLDNYLKTKIKNSGLKEFLVFHPSWGYFAKAYGLKQIPVEIEGKEPGLKELGQIVDIVKKRNIKAIFVQKQFSMKSAEAISRETGAKVIQIDPLSGDYEKNLKNVADLFIENQSGM